MDSRLVKEGYLNNAQISNLGKIEDSKTLKNGKVVKYLYNVRWYVFVSRCSVI